MKCWCTVAERAILIEHNLVRKSGEGEEEEEVIKLVVGDNGEASCAWLFCSYHFRCRNVPIKLLHRQNHGVIPANT